MVLRYHDLLSFVQNLFPGMRVTRQRNLAFVALGVLQVRDAHLTLTEIARALPTKRHHWYKFKRLWRFLSNEKRAPQARFQDLMAFLLQRFHPGLVVPVIIDQRTLGGKWEVLWASIPRVSLSYRFPSLPSIHLPKPGRRQPEPLRRSAHSRRGNLVLTTSNSTRWPRSALAHPGWHCASWSCPNSSNHASSAVPSSATPGLSITKVGKTQDGWSYGTGRSQTPPGDAPRPTR